VNPNSIDYKFMHELQKRFESEINAISQASNYIAKQQYVTSHGGNLSCRVDKDIVLITPTKVPKKDIQFKDIVLVNMDGETIYASQGRKPTGEMPFHLHVFNKRPDFNALVHAHPPIITGLAIAHSDLLEKPLLPEPIIEIGPVLPVPYKEPLSQELANAFDQVLEKSNAYLMLNHGITLGSIDGIGRAVEFLEMLEMTARSATIASSLGEVVELTDQEILDLENVMRTRNLPMPGAPGVVKNLIELYRK
jgi:L-fuculose-phosphate aldolase